MTWSLKIANVGGTAVRIHVTFVLILVWFWFLYYQIGGTAAAWEGVLFILAVFFCVLLHEFGHAFAAKRYGIRTPDITLLPIGGLARLERMPEEPWQEFVIAIAGPLVNVAIAFLLFLYIGATVSPEDLAAVGDPRGDFFVRLAAINVFLVAFNMIPAFPMDGGRVLRAALAARMSWPRATQIAATIGQGFAFALGFIGLFLNPILIFIAIFVYLAAAAEAQNAQIRDVATSVLASDVMVTDFARLPESATVDDAIETLLATTQSEFPIVDRAGRMRGLLTRDDMIRAVKEHGPHMRVTEVMRTGIPTVHRRQSLEGAFRLMQESGASAVAVLDSAEHLVGLVTHETIGEMMMLRSAVPEGFRFGHLRNRLRRPAA